MGGWRAAEAGASPISGLRLLLGPWACTVPAVRFPLFRAPRPGSGTLLPSALSSGVLLGVLWQLYQLFDLPIHPSLCF